MNKFSKSQLKKEHKLVSTFLKKQSLERKKILKKCPALVSLWKNEWDWDESTFFDDYTLNFNDLVSEYENRDIEFEK